MLCLVEEYDGFLGYLVFCLNDIKGSKQLVVVIKEARLIETISSSRYASDFKRCAANGTTKLLTSFKLRKVLGAGSMFWLAFAMNRPI
jgi:hypothetical protein